jgi:hypothetical protein
MAAVYLFNGMHVLPETWPVCREIVDIAICAGGIAALTTCLDRCGIRIE